MKFGEKLFETKLLSRLSRKVCSLLSSPVLLRKFTNFTIRILGGFMIFRTEKIGRHNAGMPVWILFLLNVITLHISLLKLPVSTSTAKPRPIYSFPRLGYRNIYFRLSGFQPSLLCIYFRYGRITCSHCADEEWQKPIRKSF